MEGIPSGSRYAVTYKETIPTKLTFGLGNALFGFYTQPLHWLAVGFAWGLRNGYSTAVAQNRSSFTENVFKERIFRKIEAAGFGANARRCIFAVTSGVASFIFSGVQYVVASVTPQFVNDGLGVLNGYLIGTIIGEEFGMLVARSRPHAQ